MTTLIRNKFFWEISYIDDINEIIIRYGKIGSIGTFFISSGYDSNEWEKEIDRKIKNKKKNDWIITNQQFITKDKLIDLRFKLYDYQGNLKLPIKNIY